jgi:hypothetical protein
MRDDHQVSLETERLEIKIFESKEERKPSGRALIIICAVKCINDFHSCFSFRIKLDRDLVKKKENTHKKQQGGSMEKQQ